ncbi:hypothetical protein K1719_002459 [Acacia pycnantha]|nr:hypothetical protein K1719_002459 [Acacia pycnantha]
MENFVTKFISIANGRWNKNPKEKPSFPNLFPILKSCVSNVHIFILACPSSVLSPTILLPSSLTPLNLRASSSLTIGPPCSLLSTVALLSSSSVLSPTITPPNVPKICSLNLISFVHSVAVDTVAIALDAAAIAVDAVDTTVSWIPVLDQRQAKDVVKAIKIE